MSNQPKSPTITVPSTATNPGRVTVTSTTGPANVHPVQVNVPSGPKPAAK